MVQSFLPFVYKETRLNIESSVPGSTVIIRLPPHSSATWSSRAAQKRPLPIEIPLTEDENAFKQKYLASAASIYHRRYHKSPRSFLWRVLEDNKVLAIRVADLYKQDSTDKAPDYYLMLRLYFPDPIRPACIALSDSPDHDVVSAFILTEKNHLYTITLRPEFFLKRSSTVDNSADWCKVFMARAFGLHHPYKLFALNSHELMVSLHNGDLLKLDRQPGDHGSAWDEACYNEGGWRGLRSLIPFQGNSTVRYGKINLEMSAVTSIATPSKMIDGIPYIFTVSLDHRLRIWNLDSRKIVYNGDLLREDRSINETAQYVVHPSQSQLVKVYEADHEKVLVVTFSPTGVGKFKFWFVTQGVDDNLELEDVFPFQNLEPPAPTTEIWTLTDFCLGVQRTDPSQLSLWVLWKNNLTYRLHRVQFQTGRPNDFHEVWTGGWVAVAGETLNDIPLPSFLPTLTGDCTEKGLEHVFYPGRFDTATIETALSLYERGTGRPKSSSLRSNNLAERMCSLVSCMTSLGHTSGSGLDYEQFHSAVDAQWRRFCRLVAELNKQRGEALSLSYDSDNGIPWVVRADGVSAVRSCSRIERFWHNANSEDLLAEHTNDVATLISAASVFRDSFSESLLHACTTLLRAEISKDGSAIDSNRIRSIYDDCNFVGHITDDDYDQLYQNLGGSLKDLLRDSAYDSLLSSMTSQEVLDDRLERLPLAELGRRTIINGIQESVELLRAICFDQLVLLIFIEGEIDQDEEGLRLDTVGYYKQFLAVYKRIELLSWLCRTQISIDVSRSERSNSGQENSISLKERAQYTKSVTVLEGCAAHLFGFVPHSRVPMTTLLTNILVGVCTPAGEYVLEPVLIQCWLLKHGRADLAGELSMYCDQNPFSIYVEGRVCLAAKELAAAATCFKKAASGLAQLGPQIDHDRHSASLLDDTEWNLLYAGLPRYYSHVVSLYDAYKYHSFVIEFARLALQFTHTSNSIDTANLQTDLQNRLFNAAIQTSLFDVAYSTISSFTDSVLQLSALRILVLHMCENSAASQLLDFPFLGLQGTVDDVLAQKCRGLVDVNIGVPYHKILYAWRVKRNDFRGAAMVCVDRLQKLQISGGADPALSRGEYAGQDALETPITNQYLALINALSCVDPKQAWILSESAYENFLDAGNRGVGVKSKVVTIQDARRGYQNELDRIAAIDSGQFDFAAIDEMDIL
ncbi:MAG: hypothetical protein M1818_007542 [Claussenomyces sp. TS43310]|nr:MAG: hypothetical protein M1818_007542 [Claussenomyces sp. TS43310]